MKTAKINTPELFESWHVTDLIVGIPMPDLNLFVQRKLFAIRPLVSGRRGEKSSRRFDAEQVFGIGLVWMLSKSGLRAEVIRQILCDITESEVAIARDAAQVLLQTGHPFLLVLRERPVPRETDAEAEDANLTTEVCYLDQIPELLGKNIGKSALVFPIGDLFDGIENGINLVEQLLKRERNSDVSLQTR